MNFELNTTALALQQEARQYAQDTLAPLAAQRDAQHIVPFEQLNAMANKGWMGINVPIEDGGMGKGVVPYSLAITEIARQDAAVAVIMSVNNMVAEVLNTFGTPAQKAQFMTPLLEGKFSAGSFCLSEPGSGSDAAGMLTRAEKTDEGWVLDGTKSWITSGQHAGVFIVWAKARIDGEDQGITVFAVDPNSEGISVGKPEEKMGQCGSDTVTLTFEQVKLPEDAVMGQIGKGFRIAMMALDGGRIGVSSLALGIAERALALGLERTKNASNQQHHAEYEALAADVEAARMLILRAAWLKQQGDRPFTQEASMAKVFATELASRASETVLGWFSLEGYTRGLAAIERLVRDARVTRIYEGTSEIQRIVIARQIMKQAV